MSIARDVLTNNDLLRYITQWHILPLPKNIINILSQDKNIIRLIWLLNDRHITMEELDKLTQKHTTIPGKSTNEFFEKLSFLEYAYFINSKNIMNYFKYTPKTINIDDEVKRLFTNASPFMTYDNSLPRFIAFYNNLPPNNIFTHIIPTLDLKNNDTIKDIINNDMATTCINDVCKFCCFCSKPRHKSLEQKYTHDDLLLFLLKSKSIDVTYLDNILKNNVNKKVRSILHFMYKNYEGTFNYVVDNYPDTITYINESIILSNQVIIDYFMFYNSKMLTKLVEKGATSLHNNIIDYLFEFVLNMQKHYHGIIDGKKFVVPLNDVANKGLIIDVFNKLGIFKEIVEFIGDGNLDEILKVRKFISDYTSNFTKAVVTYNKPSFVYHFSNLKGYQFAIMHKKDITKYLFVNKHYKALLAIIDDDECNIDPVNKLMVLVENSEYDKACEYLCFDENFSKNIFTNYIFDYNGQDFNMNIGDVTEKNLILSYISIKIAKYVCKILKELPDKTDTICKKLESINYNLKFLDLEKEEKSNVVIKILNVMNNNIYEFNDVINSTIICFLPNFEDNFKKLNSTQKNICVKYLSKTNNKQLLSKIILNRYITFDFDIKLDVLLNMKLYDVAIDFIEENFGDNINADTHDLLQYIYDNMPTNIDIIKHIFTNTSKNNKILIINSLSQSLNNFCDIFIMMCDNLKSVSKKELSKFVNTYNLSKHINHFINNPSDNDIIKNITLQNLLNMGKPINFTVQNKMIYMTQNIYKKNVKNINDVIQNHIINDHNMLYVLYQYTKKLYQCPDMSLYELQTFLQKISFTENITDDLIYNNFNFEEGDIHCNKWLFDYLVKNNFKKCVRAFFLCMSNNKECQVKIFNKEHIKETKDGEMLNMLIKFNKYYEQTLTPLKFVNKN
jgi:hypothetical protein